MAHDNKGVSKEEAVRRAREDQAVQLEDPAAENPEQREQARQPAQVKPGDASPAAEDVPPPGDMGPPEGPGS